jgi:hypothetical protein
MEIFSDENRLRVLSKILLNIDTASKKQYRDLKLKRSYQRWLKREPELLRPLLEETCKETPIQDHEIELTKDNLGQKSTLSKSSVHKNYSPNPFHKTLKIWEEDRTKQQMNLKQHEHHEEGNMIIRRKHDRRQLYRSMTKKTIKGQPILNSQVESLLAKIQKLV